MFGFWVVVVGWSTVVISMELRKRVLLVLVLREKKRGEILALTTRELGGGVFFDMSLNNLHRTFYGNDCC